MRRPGLCGGRCDPRKGRRNAAPTGPGTSANVAARVKMASKGRTPDAGRRTHRRGGVSPPFPASRSSAGCARSAHAPPGPMWGSTRSAQRAAQRRPYRSGDIGQRRGEGKNGVEGSNVERRTPDAERRTPNARHTVGAASRRPLPAVDSNAVKARAAHAPPGPRWGSTRSAQRAAKRRPYRSGDIGQRRGEGKNGVEGSNVERRTPDTS